MFPQYLKVPLLSCVIKSHVEQHYQQDLMKKNSSAPFMLQGRKDLHPMSYQVRCTRLFAVSCHAVYIIWTTCFCDRDAIIVLKCMCASHTDLATQMRYLTDVSSSPQLKRSSKVLSWISESGEMFDLEGTGQLYTSAREMSESDGCE